MDNIVLDTWPLIAFFENEKAAATIEQILKDSRLNNSRLLISAVNAGEVWYTIARVYSTSEADRILQEIEQLNVIIVPATWSLAKIAANFKREGGISYADCFAAALAVDISAPLVTGDPEFGRLEDRIDVIWV